MIGGIARSRVQHQDEAVHNQGFSASHEEAGAPVDDYNRVTLVRRLAHIHTASGRTLVIIALNDSAKSAYMKSKRSLWQYWIMIRKQFTFLKSVIMIFLFFISNCIFFAHFEDWSILEAVYFSVVTITTTGYGDLKPTSDESRLYTIFVIVFGVVLIFSTIQDFGNHIINYALRLSEWIYNEFQLRMLKEEERLTYIAKMNSLQTRKTVAEIEEENIKRHVNELTIQVVFMITLILMGSLFFSYNEDISYFRAFYFCIVTSASVGYGDINIYEETSLLFAIFYILISVILVTSAIGSFAGLSLQYRAADKRKKLALRKLDFDMLNSMDKDGDGISRIEFLSYVLERTLDISKGSDIDPWLRRFDELDADGSGFLTKEDIDILKAKEQERVESVEEAFRKEKRRRLLRSTLLDMTSPKRPLSFNDARERFSRLFVRNEKGELEKGDKFKRLSILMMRRKSNSISDDPDSIPEQAMKEWNSNNDNSNNNVDTGDNKTDLKEDQLRAEDATAS